ncbi:Uncharacterized membrane protein YpjA [Marininema mesophilum]|uniref:Uncharacterized membrane protein YpjA n=1 Tax=Marininema mesophilum TaxID=1048340 RepID=A0A1H2UU40_9BACL|nr:DUF1405 domain-containing protein [Marininema mesophilum]SDW59620.1 Uncharacterized membrane protein YpjA [Marininema mesophilum]
MIRNAWQFFISKLDDRNFLLLLFLVNLLGTLYGYYWYKNQLAMTKPSLLIFVPDSPTASAGITIVLFLYLIHRRSPLMEAFAGVTLFKYGIWAVIMIIVGAARADIPFLSALQWTDWMLMTSHLAMAVEGILYSRFFTFKWHHLAIVGAWTLLNDEMDYGGWNLHPWLPVTLYGVESSIALFTVILSLVSLALFAYIGLSERKERKWDTPLLWENQRPPTMG